MSIWNVELDSASCFISRLAQINSGSIYYDCLQLYTKKVPLDPNVDLQAVAASCNGYVGADLEALCREATMLAVKRSTDIGENPGALILTMEDWKHAKSVVGPSITRGVTVEIPKVSWEDVGGLKDLKVSIACLFSVENLGFEFT